MNKKPTGKLGFVRVSVSGAIYNQIVFPDSKDEVEKFVADKFILNSNIQNGFLLITDCIKNTENDYDFSLKTTVGNKYMDLMELAPKELMKNGHKDISNHYNDLELSKLIWKGIDNKSNHYGKNTKDLFLLIYPTDFRFNINDLIIQHLKFLSNKNNHCFEMIFYFSLLDSNEGLPRLIYPSDINTFDEEKYKNNTTYCLF